MMTIWYREKKLNELKNKSSIILMNSVDVRIYLVHFQFSFNNSKLHFAYMWNNNNEGI